MPASPWDNAARVQPSPTAIGSLGVALTWRPAPGVQAEVSYGAWRNRVALSGPLDIQDRGLQVAVTVHPMSLFAPRG